MYLTIYLYYNETPWGSNLFSEIGMFLARNRTKGQKKFKKTIVFHEKFTEI